MDGDDSTDDEGSAGKRRQPAASSSQTSTMTQEELRVMKRLEEKLRNFSSIVRIKEVRKPNSETIITLNVSPAFNSNTCIVVVSHSVDPVSGISGFRANTVPETDWLEPLLSEFCSSSDCRTLNCLVQKIVQLVEQRRLDILMNSLVITENGTVSDEEPESGESMSSGTTAASPQSSRSTTTSIP